MTGAQILLMAALTLAPAQYGPGADADSAPSSAPAGAPAQASTAAASRAPIGAAPDPYYTLPASQPLSQPDSPPGLTLESCQERLVERDYGAARVCYRRLAGSGEESSARVAGELAQLTLSLEQADARAAATRAATADAVAPEVREQVPIAEQLVAGKVELVLWSGIYGLWFGGLETAAVLSLGLFYGVESASLVLSALLMLPVANALVGLVASTLAVGYLPQLSAGDANLIRTGYWLGAFNAVAAGVLQSSIVYRANGLNRTAEQIPWLMLGVSGLVPALHMGAAAFVELPDGGVALAASGALWSGVLAFLGLAMAEFPLELEPSVVLLTTVADMSYLALLMASPWLPFSRPETWALDLGSGLGLLIGVALAFGLNAPNPVVGYGTMALGTVAGGAAGLSAAYLSRHLLEGLELPELPDIVAVGPAMIPGPSAQRDHRVAALALQLSF